MDVLVLSKTWEPIDRVPWQQVFTKMFGAGGVQVVEYHDEKLVHSNGGLKEWKVPSIVRFIDAVTPTIKGIKFSRENIYTRDQGRCQYCGVKVAYDDFEFEHVIPRSRGGTTTWENIVVACTGCNQKKGNKTPKEASMKMLSTPRKPDHLKGKKRITLSWSPGMPESWRSYMRDATYWKTELENNNPGE